MIKPIIKFNIPTQKFECHRAMIVGVGETRREAWDAMWAIYYDVRFSKRRPANLHKNIGA